MNRHQRRQQHRIAKRLPNRSRVTYTTGFQVEFESFDTIERLFQQIRNGSLSWDQKDGWVIMGLSGEDLHILSALEGWLKYWRTLADGQNIAYDDGPMRRLAKSLEYEKPLLETEVEAAYAIVQIQRNLYRTLPKSLTSRVSREVQHELRRNDEIRDLLGKAA